MDILIVTGRFGQGHWSAARAFEQHIHLVRPDARVTVADLWQQALGDAGSRRVYRLFGAMVRREVRSMINCTAAENHRSAPSGPC